MQILESWVHSSTFIYLYDSSFHPFPILTRQLHGTESHAFFVGTTNTQKHEIEAAALAANSKWHPQTLGW